MAEKEKKKSFIVYVDLADTVAELTDAQAGRLFKMLFAHEKGEEVGKAPQVVMVIFKMIKAQLIRNTAKYAKTVEVNRGNGIKSGEVRAKKALAKRTKMNENERPLNVVQKIEPTRTNRTDKDNDKGIGIDKGNGNDTVTERDIKTQTPLAPFSNKLFDLEYFKNTMHWDIEIPEPLRTALNSFMVWRQTEHPHKQGLTGPTQLEAILMEFNNREIGPEKAAKCVAYTISRGSKNMLYETGEKESKQTPQPSGEPNKNLDQQIANW